MTPEVQTRPTNIADVLREYNAENVPDLSSTIKRVESVNTVKFVFHPWIELKNFGPDGFAFQVQYAVLQRLKLIPIPVFDYARIVPVSNNFSLMSAVVGDIGAIPSRNQNKVETLMQMPTTSVEALKVAYSKFGMVELASLESFDEQSLRASFMLFGQVFREAEGEADLAVGHRPPGLLLEDYPAWLDVDAPRLLEQLRRAEILTEMDRAEQLVAELRESIRLAEEAALSPSVGILPKTKEGLNITANHGVGGKTHLDELDVWLLKQYPSFEMDTDVERARNAMQQAIESGNQGNQDLMKLMAGMMQQQQEQLALLTQLVAGKPATRKPAAAE